MKDLPPQREILAGDASRTQQDKETIKNEIAVILNGVKDLPPIATCRRSFISFRMTNETIENEIIVILSRAKNLPPQREILAGDASRTQQDKETIENEDYYHPSLRSG